MLVCNSRPGRQRWRSGGGEKQGRGEQSQLKKKTGRLSQGRRFLRLHNKFILNLGGLHLVLN